MTFWIAAAILMGLCCLTLLMALRPAAQGTQDHDRLFYDRQMAEIDRQQRIGLIGDAEAEAARIEAARRLLSTSETSDQEDISQPAIRRASVAVLLLVPLIALPVYLSAGSPAVPSFALAARPKPPAEQPGETALKAMVARIEAHLASNPEDGRGHDVVAPVYLRLNRADDAVKSYAAALRLLGPSAERHAGLGEALVYRDNGTISAEAEQAFRAAVALKPQDIKSRFFLGLRAAQENRTAEAIDWLSGVEADLPESTLRTQVRQNLQELRGRAGASPSGPEAFSPEQREAITGMVEGLAERLARQGGSAEEWARLVRALTVLGQNERAQAILAEARLKFAENPAALRQIEDAAKTP